VHGEVVIGAGSNLARKLGRGKVVLFGGGLTPICTALLHDITTRRQYTASIHYVNTRRHYRTSLHDVAAGMRDLHQDALPYQMLAHDHIFVDALMVKLY